MLKKPLIGMVALVTGASKGIGAAICQILLEEGATVVAMARTQADLTKLKEDLLQTHPDGMVDILAGSVADITAVKTIVQQVLEKHKRIDILINNAGVCPEFKLFHEISLEDLEATLDINLKGPLYLMREVLPSMIDHGGGTIINLNSVAGKHVFPFSTVYCGTKFALSAVTESIALEQQRNGIKVVGIYPGEVLTPMWSGIEPHVTHNPDRMLQAKDVAEAVRYVLCQPEGVVIKDVTVVPLHPPHEEESIV